MAQFVDYAKCMRSHGIHDFPDPVATPGGGIAFQVNGGPGSDLDRNNPTFEAAGQACRSLLPGGGQVPATVSAHRVAAEINWARCMRSHGLRQPQPQYDQSHREEAPMSTCWLSTEPQALLVHTRTVRKDRQH
jgi:hypothetical protein